MFESGKSEGIRVWLVVWLVLLVGCGPRPIGVGMRPVGETNTYQGACERLLATIDTVTVDGHVTLEDRSPIAEGTYVASSSTFEFERRFVGSGWQKDETATVAVEDTAGISGRGEYHLVTVGLRDDRLVQEVPFQSPEGQRGFVRFVDFAGISLHAEGGGGTAKDLLVRKVQAKNRFDFTLRYPANRIYVIVDQAVLQHEPSYSSGTLGRLAFGTAVDEIRQEEGWKRVKYAAGQYGWLAADQVGGTDALVLARDRREAERAKRIDRMGYTREVTAALKAHKVGEGMSPEMVVIAWGEPDRKEEITLEEGNRERWLYLPRDGRGSRQLIFSDDRVIEIRED